MLDDESTLNHFIADLSRAWKQSATGASNAHERIQRCAEALQTALHDIPAADRPLHISSVDGLYCTHYH
jgi:hypothetical protein